jgi:hypothetical protein
MQVVLQPFALVALSCCVIAPAGHARQAKPDALDQLLRRIRLYLQKSCGL